MDMIKLDNVSKTFKTSSGDVEALNDCTLHIEKGEICGVIGYSGAGKSTLVRLINRLEAPDSGTVTINGRNLAGLSKKELLIARRKIGMIFQHFNLLNSVTVFDNIAAPLINSGVSKKDTAEKVAELLKLVSLQDKIYAYPTQLSGGQKQRVAIARALACDPDILLCDEATSALDPGTTAQILELIKDISKKLDLTVVVIAHQMDVIKAICQNVAVMDNARIVEYGDIVSIFSNPKEAMTKEFIAQGESKTFFTENEFDRPLYRLTFVGGLAETPFISQLVEKYHVAPNILYGNIQRLGKTAFGSLILDIEGTNAPAAVEFLKANGVGVEIIKPGQTIALENETVCAGN
ncbi:methionine ABC transporter ATP-binding protein [Tyzzerella sp. OttesenSCG-928-J15]|nr:methionine ABC transporter ATP-binding protein [Tyzzerella sp. OttesenSCG-928-J15]